MTVRVSRAELRSVISSGILEKREKATVTLS